MKVHLIGVGGIGMSALAQILLARGDRVFGSDAAENELTRRVRSLGGRIRVGHAAANLNHPDLVVYSNAVPPANPELVAARNRGIPVLSRGRMLARLIAGRRAVAVSGAHGKSTTAALIAEALIQAGWDPTVLLGAELRSQGSNARAGRGRWAVVETDESDGSFLWLTPQIAVITNLDDEHLDYFRSRREIKRAYADFAGRVRRGGTLIGCADDPAVRRLLRRTERHTVTYGFSEGAQVRAVQVQIRPGGSRYWCLSSGRELGQISLPVPGPHNVLNSLAAVAVAQALGIRFQAVRRALEGYQGIKRRFQIHGEPGGVMVVEDYAHHPAEIRATLQAARSWRGRRIRCLFQPHRYSRTRFLMRGLASSLARADEVTLLPVYAASELPLKGATADALARAIRAQGQRRVRLLEPGPALKVLAATSRPGDTVLFLGAGSVGALAARFAQQLHGN